MDFFHAEVSAVAIYHLHVGYVSRATGRSAVAASAYRAAEKLKNEYDGISHDYREKSNAINSAAYHSGERLGEFDYTRKRGVVHTEIMLPEYAPKYFLDRAALWNAVEKMETRKNSRTARNIDVALPVEFNRQEQIEVMREYIQNNFVKYGMIADFAIHDKSDGNPHAHILLTTRNVDKSGFKSKNRDWDKVQYLLMWRENWAKVCNEKLQDKELDERIDHRTLEAQGIDREPTIHIGVTAKALERKGIITERVQLNREIIARNEAKASANTAQYVLDIEKAYLVLNEEITALLQEKNEADQEARRLNHRAEQIKQRSQDVKSARNREYAENYFKQMFKIAPHQAEAEIKRFEDRARSLGNLRDKLQEKLAPLIEERDNFARILEATRPETRVPRDYDREHEREREREFTR
jgi:hypothetical protein